jgi:hypothetical protein
VLDRKADSDSADAAGPDGADDWAAGEDSAALDADARPGEAGAEVAAGVADAEVEGGAVTAAELAAAAALATGADAGRWVVAVGRGLAGEGVGVGGVTGWAATATAHSVFG